MTNSIVVEEQPVNSIDAISVVQGRQLTKKFGRRFALSGLDITVPRGSVYGLLGRNGAGKSTLIQLIMGMLEPTSGSLTVLGLNPVTEDVAVKQQLGYIPERLQMYDWMTVEQTLRFVSTIYTNWSVEEENRLAKQFRLQRDQKIGALSRGNRALLSLVIAMAHQPEFVLLDECTSGMDALARREFERSVIDALSGAGRTVLFAGHQLGEMERICDWIGMMHSGKMIIEQPMDDLKQEIITLRLGFDGTVPRAIPGATILISQISGNELFLTVRLTHSMKEIVIPEPYSIKEVVPLSLEEIFVAVMTAEDQK